MRQALALAVAGLLASAGAGAQELPVGTDLEALGWWEYTYEDLPANRFIGHDDGRLEVVSENSISALVWPLRGDPARTACLAWRWRVDQAGPPTDLRRRGTDDRALALYVGFPYNPAKASFWEALVRGFVELVAGTDAPGRVISYSWGGLGTRGQVQASPYLGTAGGIVLLRPGIGQPRGVWLDETVDLAADYRRIFDDPPDAPSQVAVLSDSDNAGGRVHAFIRDIRFVESCD